MASPVVRRCAFQLPRRFGLSSRRIFEKRPRKPTQQLFARGHGGDLHRQSHGRVGSASPIFGLCQRKPIRMSFGCARCSRRFVPVDSSSRVARSRMSSPLSPLGIRTIRTTSNESTAVLGKRFASARGGL